MTDDTFLELSNYYTYPWVVGVSCIDNKLIEIFWFDLFLSDMTVGQMVIFSPRAPINYFFFLTAERCGFYTQTVTFY